MRGNAIRFPLKSENENLRRIAQIFFYILVAGLTPAFFMPKKSQISRLNPRSISNLLINSGKTMPYKYKEIKEL